MSPQGLIKLGTALIFGGFGLMTLAAILGATFRAGEGFVIVGFFLFLFGLGSFPLLLFLHLDNLPFAADPSHLSMAHVKTRA